MNAQASSQLGSRVSSLDNLLSSSRASSVDDFPSPPFPARTTKIESGETKPSDENPNLQTKQEDVSTGIKSPGVSVCPQKKKVHFDTELSKSTPHLATKGTPGPSSKNISSGSPLSEILLRSVHTHSPKSKSEIDLSSSSHCTPLSVKFKEVPEPKSPVFKEQLLSVVTKTKDLESKATPEVNLVSGHKSPPQKIVQTDRSTPTLESNQISLSHEDLKKIVSDSDELLDCNRNIKQDTKAQEYALNTTVSYVPIPAAVQYQPPVTFVSPYFYPVLQQHNPMILTPVPPTPQHYHCDYPHPKHQLLTTAEINPCQATQTSLSFEEYCRQTKKISSEPGSKTSKIPVFNKKHSKSDSFEEVHKPSSSRSDDLISESSSLETNSYRTNLQLFGYKPVAKDSTKFKPDIPKKPTNITSPKRPVSVACDENITETREPLSREDEYYSLPSDSTESSEQGPPPSVNYSTLPRSLHSPSWQEIFDSTPPLQLPEPSSSMESALSIDPIVGSRVPSARPTKLSNINSPSTPTAEPPTPQSSSNAPVDSNVVPASNGPPKKASVSDRMKFFEKAMEESTHPSPKPERVFSFLSQDEIEKLKQEEERKIATLSKDELKNLSRTVEEDEDEEDSGCRRIEETIETTETLISCKPASNDRVFPFYFSTLPKVHEHQAADNTSFSNVRTAKAERRMKERMIQEGLISDDEDKDLSPAEQRALRAEKRAAWRQARLKSLEQDALQAQFVIKKMTEMMDSKPMPEPTNNNINNNINNGTLLETSPASNNINNNGALAKESYLDNEVETTREKIISLELSPPKQEEEGEEDEDEGEATTPTTPPANMSEDPLAQANSKRKRSKKKKGKKTNPK
ncbi:hypothetical protein M8J75_001256 [Diaphorina citri]|nr:hypothetical protein M8J75_001256 [Diaphorina citri]